jgi:hypothetical protein
VIFCLLFAIIFFVVFFPCPLFCSDYFGSRIDLLLRQSALLLFAFPAAMQVDEPVVLVAHCK